MTNPNFDIPPVVGAEPYGPLVNQGLNSLANFGVNPKAPHFGAVGDDLTDDSDAFNEALEEAGSLGFPLVVPPGEFRVANLVYDFEVPIIGSGQGRTILRQKAGSNTHILDASAPLHMRHLTIDGDVGSQTLGGNNFAINLNAGADGSFIFDVHFKDIANIALELFGVDGCRIIYNEFSGCIQPIRLRSAAHKNLIQGNEIHDSIFGIYIRGADGEDVAPCERNRIYDNHIYNITGADPDYPPALGNDGACAAAGAPWTKIHNNHIHDCAGRGIHVWGNCGESSIQGNTVRSVGITSGVSGIDTSDNATDQGLNISGNIVSLVGAAGIYSSGGQRLIISTNVCTNNGQSSDVLSPPQAKNGITIDMGGAGDPANYINCIGNICIDTQGSPTQEYGIAERGGAHGDHLYVNYIGNQCQPNKTGSMNLISRTSHAKDNIGFNPRGATTVTVTASPFTYTNYDNCTEALYIRSGTISDISKNAIPIWGAGTDRVVLLEPEESVTITYSSPPVVVTDRK